MSGKIKSTFLLKGYKLAIVILSILILALLNHQVQAEGKRLDLRTGVSHIAKKAIPAVVHVEVTQKSETINPLLPFENDPFLRRYFNIPKLPKKFKREVKGIGTGMLIDPAGYILTNSHVVEAATKIQVLLANGCQFNAKLIGTDPKTDLAIIKISGKGPFPFLKFGNSDKVEVGEWVIAIGHPRGLDQTVTAGIISAKNRRSIADPSSYQDFLQTDAAINPGNSGGPLLNLSGEVIGVNSAIASASGGFEGIGFAIPSKMVQHVSEELMKYGKVERGWLGVSIQDLSYEQAKSLGLATSKGALISEIVQNSPAEKAGIQPGDVVLDYKGVEITDSSELRNLVSVTPIGENAKLTIWRKGEKKIITAKIGNLETATKLMATAVQMRLGAEFRALTAKELEKYGLEAKIGVAITKLSQSSPLKEAGIEVDDIILGVDGQMVEDMDAFIGFISTIPKDQKVSLLILDHRTGSTGSLDIMLK